MQKLEWNNLNCYGDLQDLNNFEITGLMINWKEFIRLSSIFEKYLYFTNVWKIHPGRFVLPFSMKYGEIYI